VDGKTHYLVIPMRMELKVLIFTPEEKLLPQDGLIQVMVEST
jgi:hypothetical protein